MKEERNGGRKDRRIESRDEEDAGEGWRHMKNNEHKGGKSNQVVTKFYKKQHMFSFTIVSFIGRKEGVRLKRRENFNRK